jgi:hypothetical protein
LAAVAVLLGQYRSAECLKRSPGELACQPDLLHATGVTDEALAALVAAGHLATNWDQQRRLYSLVLTPQGAAFATQLLFPAVAGQAAQPASGLECPPSINDTPRWEAPVRKLWLGEQLVLWLRRRAPNQECLLASFEELQWRERIDDPLPAGGGVDREERLVDTVKSLNRGQACILIRFRVTADRLGVYWEPVT